VQPLASNATRVLVIDDLEFLRAGLSQVLRRLGAFRVEAVASGSSDADAIELGQKDLVVLGPHLVVSPSAFARAVKTSDSDALVMHLADGLGRGEFIELLRSGVDAVVPVTLTQTELARVLVRIQRGERVFEGIALEAVRQELTAVEDDRRPVLTRKEHDVLALLASNRRLRDVADDLHVGLATVKSHTASIYMKLGVNNRSEAVQRAVAERILG